FARAARRHLLRRVRGRLGRVGGGGHDADAQGGSPGEDDARAAPLRREPGDGSGRGSPRGDPRRSGGAARPRRRRGPGPPGARPRPLRPIAAAQGAILDRLDRMIWFMTAVILALAALCLGTTLFTLVVEREGEIGLLRSLGADDADVARIVLGEATILGLLGG